MKPVYEYTIKLLRYVLNGDVPKMPENIDYRELYDFSASHSVENMIYVALSELKMPVPEDIMLEFEDSYYRAVEAEALQSIELEAISEAFEEAGIDFMPLKGSVIKHLYPMPDYRKCGDIDILVKHEDLEKANERMLALGFCFEKNNEERYHFEYAKPPYIKVEIHSSLMSKITKSYDYLSNIWAHAQLIENYRHRYIMTSNAQYIYCIAHLINHIRFRGAGIKFINDIWLYNKKYDKIFLSDEVMDGLEKCSATIIEEWSRKLAEKWFSDKLVNDENVDMLESFIFKSGTFGTNETGRMLEVSQMEDNAVIHGKYAVSKFVSRVFLPYKVMVKQYPVIEKYKILYPISWIWRINKMLFKEKRTVKGAYMNAVYVDYDSAKEYGALYDAIN